ncbi:MAG: M23 family metallopeptidase [Candidatus Polarisedimenticolaceae bacterium]|nr:M23 family metallopeptidase [Candidatus Polarisedimenticolaceae bacterium]
MRIILLSKTGKSLSASGRSLTAVAGLFSMTLISGLALWSGYNMGLRDAPMVENPTEYALNSLFERERRNLKDAKTDVQQHIDAISMRVGQLQAHILRLDALGERLTQVGDLDKGEFSFEQSPPMGGPTTTDTQLLPESLVALMTDIESLDRQIDSREQQLSLLEDLMMNQTLQDESLPAGRPINSGWTSSYFGMRNDPFTGRRAMHKGVDFAGKLDSDVVAVAGGVVTVAEKRYGYGLLVEIHHGRGYVTRYGHNKNLLVEEGERVQQGQVISKMGSSGRSTGPHVHFEVMLNGKQINPLKYIKRQREPPRS